MDTAHSSNLPRRITRGAALFLLPVLLAPDARAELRFSQPTADAGEVRGGAPLNHSFAFTNDGPEPVEIVTARVSCGCLAPRLEKRVYGPGESGSLLLEVNTLTQAAGPHTWAVQVAWQGGGRTGDVTLSLSGRVVREINVEPAALTVFSDSGIRHQIVLTDLRPKPLTVTDVRTSSSRLKARLAGPDRDAQGHVVSRVVLELADDYPEGRHDEAVHLFTDDPTYRDLKVPVTLIKRSRQRVTATPDAVTLRAPAGQPLPSRIVLLHDREDAAVVVDRVEADDPALVCRWAPGPNNRATVKISADRARIHGDILHTAVHVHVRQPAPVTVTVLVTCILE
jgi:hypothetical protein